MIKASKNVGGISHIGMIDILGCISLCIGLKMSPHTAKCTVRSRCLC